MISEAWNIGGTGVYKTQLEDKNTIDQQNKLFLTELEETFDCDTFYPVEYLQSLKCEERGDTKVEKGIKYTFSTLTLP